MKEKVLNFLKNGLVKFNAFYERHYKLINGFFAGLALGIILGQII